MSESGRRNASFLLIVALMLSLLSLIVISIMALFQLTMGMVSENTVIVLFCFTMLPSTIASWMSLFGRLRYLDEYDSRQDATMKATITLALAMVLTSFCYFMVQLIL
jgi:hypothetical protein